MATEEDETEEEEAKRGGKSECHKHCDQSGSTILIMKRGRLFFYSRGGVYCR